MLKLADEYSEAISMLKQKCKEKTKVSKTVKNNENNFVRK